MTKHQRQAHDATTKRSCLQWRPLNEILMTGKKQKANKALPWRPLDEILQTGTLLQQQIDAEKKKDKHWEVIDQSPASPVPSEQSQTTVDEEFLLYDPTPTTTTKIDHWYPSHNQPWYPYNDTYLNYPSFHII